MDWIAKLESGVSLLGLQRAAPSIYEKLFAYQKILSKWNAAINLTAHRSEEVSLEKNFLDCLVLGPFFEGDEQVLDLGSGAGFPGLILKIIWPELRLVLVESDKRKASFLATVVRELELLKVELKADFFESEKIAVWGWLSAFDAVVSRATFALSQLVESSVSCLKKDGRLFGMVSGHEQPCDFALHLPLKLQKIQSYCLPFSKLERKIVVYQRV